MLAFLREQEFPTQRLGRLALDRGAPGNVAGKIRLEKYFGERSGVIVLWACFCCGLRSEPRCD